MISKDSKSRTIKLHSIRCLSFDALIRFQMSGNIQLNDKGFYFFKRTYGRQRHAKIPLRKSHQLLLTIKYL